MSLIPFGGFGGLLPQFDNLGAGPYAHVRESKDAALLELEVPRFRPEDIKVTADGSGHLTVTGNMPRERTSYDPLFTTLLFGDLSPSGFSRRFYFPTSVYDATKFKTSLGSGVLSITVPKVLTPTAPQAPTAVTLFGGETHNIEKLSGKELRAIEKMSWPPSMKVDDTKEAVTYTCTMSPSITREHIELQLVGDALRFSVKAAVNVERKEKDGKATVSEHSSVNYSTMMSVPKGTKPQDITTTYDNGKLTVTLAKHLQDVPVQP